MDVVLYSTMVCPQCHRARSFLEESGVTFREIDLVSDKTLREDIIKRCGVRIAPVVEINGSLFPGFNREKLSAALKNAAAEQGSTQ